WTPLNPGTSVGTTRSVGSGTPRLPRKLVPQHATRPSAHNAQLCDQPVEMPVTSPEQAFASRITTVGGKIFNDTESRTGAADGDRDPQLAARQQVTRIRS